MMDDEKEFHGLDLRLARLARFLIRRRREALIIQVVVLIGCIWAISGMRLHDDPNAWPPHTDSFVKLNKRIAEPGAPPANRKCLAPRWEQLRACRRACSG